MTAQVDTHRELLFVVSEVDETRNPLEIIKRITASLACGEIGIVDRDLLLGTLYRNCRCYGIDIV